MHSQGELAVQVSLGWVFGMSAISKAARPLAFARAVTEYEALPRWLMFVGAIGLIPAELFLGVSHITGWAIKFSAPAGCLLLTLFGVVVFRQLKSGRITPCYCFGANSSDLVSYRSIWRLVLMMVAELTVVGTGGVIVYRSYFGDAASVFTALGLTTIVSVLAVWAVQFDNLLCLLPSSWTASLKGIASRCEGAQV